MCRSQDASFFVFATGSVVRPRFYTSFLFLVTRHPVRDWDRASHNQLFPGSRGRDRGQEFEQVQQSVASLDLKAQAQRRGQRRHEAGTRLSPKRTLDENDQPPLPPPLQGSAVYPEGIPQHRHSFGLEAMGHSRNQHDDKAGVNAPPHKAHRWRSMPSSTVLLVATKAATLWLFRPRLATPRFALVVGPVQFARAVAAAIGSLNFRQIEIDLLKEWV